MSPFYPSAAQSSILSNYHQKTTIILYSYNISYKALGCCEDFKKKYMLVRSSKSAQILLQGYVLDILSLNFKLSLIGLGKCVEVSACLIINLVQFVSKSRKAYTDFFVFTPARSIWSKPD